jgi:hypothetical protein
MFSAGKYLIGATVLLLAGFSIQAQTTTAGSISGQVQDSQGAVVPNAKVTLINEAQGGGSARELTTGPEGTYVFSPVLPGTYTLTVEAAGFKKYNQAGIVLNASDKLGLAPIALEVGAASESVTIEANAVQLQTVTAERAGVVDSQQIVDIALNGRNFNNLIRTVPGALADGTLSVNGQRTDQGNFTVDGQTVIDTGVNVQTNFGYRISVDAIAEFKVSSNAMSAEFGRNSGAQIQVVTKSGTKDFHGTGYWFKRGEFMNANTFVNNASPIVVNGKSVAQFPIYRFMTAGYNLGGPVYIPGKFNTDKQKLFFFFSHEWNRQTVANIPRQITVPTALERQGNFSQTRDSAGVPVTINDPQNGAPFPGNIIPSSRFNQFGQAILNYLPPPNISGNPLFNYQSQASNQSPQFDEVYRGDYNISDKWHLFGRILRSHNTQNNPYGRGDSANQLALSPLYAPTFAWPNFTLNLTTIINPTLTNEVQYGYTKNGIPGNAPPSGSPYYRTVSNLQIPLLFPNADPSGLVPNFGFAGVPSAAGTGGFLTSDALVSQFNGLPYANENPVQDVIDNLAKVKGNHTIKTGFFFEHAVKTESAFGDVNSTIAFGRDTANPNDSNWAFSNALLGNFRSYTQFSRYPIGHYPYVNVEWYLQDSWKVTQKLTLNYGIRFSYIPPTYEQNNNIANFDPSKYDPSKAVRLFQPALIGGQRVAYDAITGQALLPAYIGFVVPGSGDVNNGNAIAGQNGYPRGLTANRGVHYGPRIGLAYALDSKTVFRAGGGIFYERIVAGMTRTQATDPPFVRQPQLLYGNISNIAASAAIQSPVSISGIGTDGHVPSVYNYSAGIQRELPLKFLFDASYVGSISRHLVMLYPINDVPFGSAWLPQNQDTTLGVPVRFDGTTTVPVNLYRPYTGYVGPTTSSFSNYGYVDNFGGTANYNGLQLALNRRVSTFSFGLQYSWSRALGVNSATGGSCSFGGGPCGVVPGNVRGTDYGPLNFDRTQQATFNYLYTIPNVSGKVSFLNNGVGKLLVGGWQLSGLTSMSGGAPVNVTYSVTNTGATLLNREITGSEDIAPRVAMTCNPNVNWGSRSIYAFVNTSCFSPAGRGSVGADSGINRLRGPGLHNWDMSLFKKIPLGKEEARFIQLRLEAYNAFNLAEWSTFNTTIQFNSAGQIVNLPTASGGSGGRFGFGALNAIRANSQRILQIAAKIYF